MIVVWVNKRNWKTPGPIVNMAINNAAAFSDLGIETHLCIGAGKASDTDSDLTDFYGIDANQHLRIHRVPRYRLFNSTYSMPVFSYAYDLIKKLSQKDSVAVFTRESGFLFFLVKLRRKLNNVRGFYELHDLYADLSWVDEKKSFHRREWFYEHLLLPRIDGLVCITREQERRYNAIFPSIPSCSFPLGTKPMETNAPAEEKRNRRTLMYVGHLDAEKGDNFLLSAARLLAKKNVRILFLGGEPRQVLEYESRAAAMGLADHVAFIPFQAPVEMHRAMAREASIGVVMLKNTYYNRYLTCPVKALDYLSCGIPAVGSDIPSVHEVLGEAGTYVPPGRMEDFVSAVLGLLDDSSRYETMVARSIQRSREISWPLRAGTLADFAAMK